MGLENTRVLKAVTSASMVGEGKGGRMNPTQAREFIRTIIANNQFLKAVRTVDMPGPEYVLDYMDIANRLIRKGIEGQAPTNIASVATKRRTLSTTEIILPVDITLHFLEDNIEGKSGEDKVVDMVATQFGNDLLDLAINGDSGSADPFLAIDDGWVKKAKDYADAGGLHRFDTDASQDYKGKVFPGMLTMLPAKWKTNLGALRFICSANVAEAYKDEVITFFQAGGNNAESLMLGATYPPFKGVQLLALPYWPDDVVMLTTPKNLAVGIQRDFMVDKEWVPRKRQVEYTMTNRIDAAEIVLDDCAVIAYDVPGE